MRCRSYLASQACRNSRFALRPALRTYDGNGRDFSQGIDTTSSFDVDSYGFSLAWAPIDSLRFRGQYQRAVRAPNVIELYRGVNTNLPDLNPAGTNSQGVQLFDPCSTAFPIATLESCVFTGLLPAQYGTGLVDDVISGQTQSITGGQPNLDPETADTLTFGFVWTGIDGLSISVDWFNILVEDAIEAGIDAQVIFDGCLADGNPILCGLMQRAPDGTLSSGTPGVGFQNVNVNIGELETTGVDVQVSWAFDSGRSSHNFDYAATIIDQLDEVPYAGADSIECAGAFANPCAPPSPEYRHRLLYTWQSPWSLDVTTTWRHFGGTDTINANETLETSLPSVDYIDLSASWYVMDESITIRFSVLNLFEEDTPVFTGAGTAPGNGNTYPSMYDTSTAFFAGLKFNF